MALRQLTGLLRTAALVRASPIGGNTARLYSSTAPESAVEPAPFDDTNEILTLPATRRYIKGKTACAKLRRQDLVPCVIFGKSQPEILIQIERRHFQRCFDTTGFRNRKYYIDLEGETHYVVNHQYSADLRTDLPTRATFYRLAPDE